MSRKLAITFLQAFRAFFRLYAKKYLPARKHLCFHEHMKHQQLNNATITTSMPAMLGMKEKRVFS